MEFIIFLEILIALLVIGIVIFIRKMIRKDREAAKQKFGDKE